ncbi:hypothetical protein [Streptomyces sp. NPDC004435]|uniref:hypothetical protein n=1 Tax=Streptomyces sp. NPDC004435 TaxID=3364701 RepID=UPI0036CB64CB
MTSHPTDPLLPSPTPAPPPAAGPHDTERLARAALTRIIEPGDEQAGHALRAHGATTLLTLLRDPREPPLPDIGTRRLAGWRHRARTTTPEADLDHITRLGGRFLIPGDFNFCRHTLCCPRPGCDGEVLCCGRVVALLDG